MVVKRIEDDDSDEDTPPTKKFAPSIVEKPTDFLTVSNEPKSPPKKDSISEGSIGLFGSNKRKLVLVKPKSMQQGTKSDASTPSTSASAVTKENSSTILSASTPSSSVSGSTSTMDEKKANKNSVGMALGLLGAYGSGTDSSSDSD